jgi:hypothetical protein
MTVNARAISRNWYFHTIDWKEGFFLMTLSRLAFRLLPALVLCGVASASTIIVATGVDTTRGGYNLAIREDNSDVQAYFTGVITISVTTGNQVFYRDSLCVDLFTDIFLGRQYATNLLRPEDVPQKNLQRASWLVDNYLQPAQDAVPGSVPAPDWVTSAVQGMGIQFAIWDIVHDNGDGFSAGRVQAARATDANNNGLVTDPTVLAWAQRYELLSLNKSNNQAFVYNNVNMGNGVPAQMLIGPQFADGGPQPVPEPQTLMPAGIALIALSLGLRRRTGKRS